MKREGKILLKIIFLLAVLFCPVISVYSNNNILAITLKQSGSENGGETNSFSDADFFDDEQINQIFDFFSGSDYVYQIHTPQNRFLISRYPTPIWQPPKNVRFKV